MFVFEVKFYLVFYCFSVLVKLVRKEIELSIMVFVGFVMYEMEKFDV